MRWNVTNIGFLHRPDDFLGSFENDKMQLRHEQQVQLKLKKIKDALDEEDDPLKAMLILNKLDHIQFLLNNVERFREFGNFETAVLRLYHRKNGPFSTPDDLPTWTNFFKLCDRKLLREKGDPIPFSTSTVYRGSVIGTNRCLSWSPDLERAQWFANRWKDPERGGGNIYEVDVTEEHALAYLTDRHEKEIILDPDFIANAEIRDFVIVE